MNRWTPVALCASLLMTACGADSKDENQVYDVRDSPLSGVVAGEAFEMQGGFAADLFGDGELWVELHSFEADDPCARQYAEGPHLILSVVPEPSDQPLGLQNNITFAYQDSEGSQNDIATTGRLIVDGVADGVLSGALFARMGEHEGDGTFAVSVCE